MAAPQMQRSIPEVLQDIVSNLQDIVRSEVRLVKIEAKEAASNAAKPVTNFAVGAIIGFYGFGFVLYAAVTGLAMVMALWQAALLVGVVLAIVALALMNSSKNKLKNISVLDKTISSVNAKENVNVKENVQWTTPIK